MQGFIRKDKSSKDIVQYINYFSEIRALIVLIVDKGLYFMGDIWDDL